MKRFVEIPEDRLRAALDDVAAKILAKGGDAGWSTRGNERVFNFSPCGKGPIGAAVAVYTTLDARTSGGTARGCGEDAVRIVLVVEKAGGAVRPIAPGRKILRTAPAGASDRVQAFLDRLTEAMRDAYRTACNLPVCPKCGRALVERKTRDGARSFMGCVGYPDCR